MLDSDQILTKDAGNRLFEIVMPDLRRLAQHPMNLKTAGETACPTAANKRLSMVGQAVSPAGRFRRWLAEAARTC